jgi:hypothetical protein
MNDANKFCCEHIPADKDAAMTTLCCGKSKITCVWEGNCLVARSDAAWLIHNCELAHEKMHYPDIDCSDVRDGMPDPGYGDDENARDASECRAYKKELSCLQKGRHIVCGSDGECQMLVGGRIEHVEKQIRKYCH